MKKTLPEAERQAMLDRLTALGDEDIDTNDIPEAPPENWALARRPVRKSVERIAPTR